MIPPKFYLMRHQFIGCIRQCRNQRRGWLGNNPNSPAKPSVAKRFFSGRQRCQQSIDQRQRSRPAATNIPTNWPCGCRYKITGCRRNQARTCQRVQAVNRQKLNTDWVSARSTSLMRMKRETTLGSIQHDCRAEFPNKRQPCRHQRPMPLGFVVILSFSRLRAHNKKDAITAIWRRFLSHHGLPHVHP